MFKNRFIIVNIGIACITVLTAGFIYQIVNDNKIPTFDKNKYQDRYAWADAEASEVKGIQAATKSSGTSYYVDSSKGNDSNPGTTQTLAFKTIQEANQKVTAGDIVYVKNGTYDENITIIESGNSQNWIVFQAFPGDKPFVRGTQDGTFKIEGNYIKIIGFRITSTQTGSGIHVGKGNHHTQVLNNEIYDSGCGGISGQETDYLYIEGNVSYRNAFRSPYQCSGISIYQAKAYDNKFGFHNIIRGNISYSNENQVPREDGKFTDGNGIIIDDFRHTQGDKRSLKYTNWTLVENNFVFDNGGRGIEVYQSDNVIVRNNTAFKNLKSRNLEGTLNGEFTTFFSSNIQFYKNIAYASEEDRKTFVDDYSNNNKWEDNISNNGSGFVKGEHSNAIFSSYKSMGNALPANQFISHSLVQQ
ncbi:MAG: right-handed parallel beta-helix repeat-containing protein [Rhizonema sp. PD37]|nr:right-handed parallel beta-helix repeat-containing protein [Rhizonema sp. PD37]